MILKNVLRFNRIIDKFESAPLTYCIVFLFCWIFLRIFIEGQFEHFHSIGLIPFSYRAVIMYFLHFPMFYLSLFLSIVIIISIINKIPIKNIVKVSSYGMMSIVFVPVLDSIIGKGYLITYPLRLEKYFISFLNPFVSLSDIGISPGQRIIIALISVLIFIYVYTKNRHIFKAVITAILGFFCIIIYGALTTVIAGNKPEMLFISGGILYTDSQKFAVIYTILFVSSFFISLSIFDREFYKCALASMRVERMAFYGGAGLFGLILANHIKNTPFAYGFFDILGVLCIFLSLAFAFWALQILNDFFDRKSDSISRSRNPLLKDINPRYYAIFGIVIALITLILAAILNYFAFLIMITYLLIGIIYSVPPIRLKRFPVASTFVLAIAVIFSLGIGFTCCFQAQALNYIPGSVIMPTLIGITLGFSAKDLNDIKADKKYGVITIPGLINTKNKFLNKFIIAVIISLSFLVYAFFIKEMLPGALVSGIIAFAYTLFAKRIREIVYFIILYLFGAYFLLILVH